MALANLHQKKPEPVISGDINISKTLAKCFGYMAIGLLITAAVAFGAGLLFVYLIFPTSNSEQISESASVAYLATMIVSAILLFIDSIVMRVVMVRGKHSILPHYIFYSVIMGVLLSSFLVAGIDFKIIGIAAASAALVFAALFFIGYFSKRNLNIAAYIGMSILFALMMFGLLSLLILVLFPTTAMVYSLIYCGVFEVVMLICIAADCYNIKHIIAKAEQGNNNIVLWCAYTMYSDFIYLFVRLVVIIASLSKRD